MAGTDPVQERKDGENEELGEGAEEFRRRGTTALTAENTALPNRPPDHGI
jgi:hypothetical protein